MQHTVSIGENHVFRALYARGKSAPMKTMVLYTRKCRQKTHNRLGLTVSVKLGGAVVRNRMRRRLKEVYRLHEHLLVCGIELVIVARHRAYDAPFSTLCAEFLRAAGRLGLLRED